MKNTPATASDAKTAVMNLLSEKFGLVAGKDFVVRGEEKNNRARITLTVNATDPRQSQLLVDLASSLGFGLHIVNKEVSAAA